MGKIRDLKKAEHIKGTFHARMEIIKDWNRSKWNWNCGKFLEMELLEILTKVEEIKKRWQEYTEELYRKGPNDLDNHEGVVTQLEPDILECEVGLIMR